MANEKLEIAGLACLLVGVPKITSFNDNTAQAKVCAEAYEPLVESELSIYRWRFATGYFNLKPNLLVDAPLSRYNTAYQIPDDVMSIDTVLVNDRPITYERRGRQVHTNDTSSDDVILQYRFRPDEREWFPFFRQLIVYRLATLVAFSVTRNSEMATQFKAMADEFYARAKTEDSQAQTNQRLDYSRLKRGRRASMDKFWRNR